MNVKLIYFGEFESEYKGQKFYIKRFVDQQSLNIIYGTNLNVELEEGKLYNCRVEIKRNKLVVTEVL